MSFLRLGAVFAAIAIFVGAISYIVGFLQTGAWNHELWPHDVKGHLGTLWICMTCMLYLHAGHK